ncbi:MAG: hypothetical protein AAFQ41_14735 [Cyanobacteria bacterium J06623_7]
MTFISKVVKTGQQSRPASYNYTLDLVKCLGMMWDSIVVGELHLGDRAALSIHIAQQLSSFDS